MVALKFFRSATIVTFEALKMAAASFAYCTVVFVNVGITGKMTTVAFGDITIVAVTSVALTVVFEGWG